MWELLRTVAWAMALPALHLLPRGSQGQRFVKAKGWSHPDPAQVWPTWCRILPSFSARPGARCLSPRLPWLPASAARWEGSEAWTQNPDLTECCTPATSLLSSPLFRNLVKQHLNLRHSSGQTVGSDLSRIQTQLA